MGNRRHYVKMGSQNRIVLPKECVDMLHVAEGDYVHVELMEADNEWVIILGKARK